jgi:hypothetical protein
MSFIRLSLAMCLVLYGCDRQYLISIDLVKVDEIGHLPSRYAASCGINIPLISYRRKIGSRASVITDPVIVDAKLMSAMKSYVEQHIDELSSLLAKFLNAFVNEASLVESYEVDNFILRNCNTVSAW